ncbi:MAG: flagellar basal-body MS-ring/collar protein FliF [Actinomycetota bacterium]|nr:flagellar basal-body MS-ring/collar protein FliF [Actinomycetota bacterium]
MAVLPTDVSRMRESARRFASGFSRGQKVVTVVSLVGVVLVAFVFMSLSGKPTYALLFTNLQPSDAAAITQQLATDHVPYELQNGGATILVPQNMVDQQRLAAAAAGLPSQTTVGLSILDKEGLTTSQLTQQADYLRALQGELEQTIDSISGVTSTQVSIALPANQTFALGNTTPTGASVLVNLQPGHSLTYGQVQAIVSLTASAVPGLSRSAVTVADSNGNLLAGPGVNDTGAAQSSASTAYDSAVQARIGAYLAGVLGAGNADVQVNAQLDFNQVSTRSNLILYGKNGKPEVVCTSTQQSSEKYTGTGAPAGVTAPTTTTGGTGTYTQGSSSKTCETSTQTQSTVEAPGGLVSQSIAVLVNSRSLPKGVSLAQLRSGVAAVAGIQPKRGDVLSFSAAPFKSTTPAAVTPAKKSILTTALRPGLALLLVLLVLFLLWRASRRARKAALAQEALLDSFALEQLAPLAHMDPPTGELPAIPYVPVPRRAGPSVQEIVDAQSEEVASVLRDWLHQTT